MVEGGKKIGIARRWEECGVVGGSFEIVCQISCDWERGGLLFALLFRANQFI